MPEFDVVDLTVTKTTETWCIPPEPPIGTVVAAADGTLWCRGDHGWLCINHKTPMPRSWGNLLEFYTKVELFEP